MIISSKCRRNRKNHYLATSVMIMASVTNHRSIEQNIVGDRTYPESQRFPHKILIDYKGRMSKSEMEMPRTPPKTRNQS